MQSEDYLMSIYKGITSLYYFICYSKNVLVFFICKIVNEWMFNKNDAYY